MKLEQEVRRERERRTERNLEVVPLRPSVFPFVTGTMGKSSLFTFSQSCETSPSCGAATFGQLVSKAKSRALDSRRRRRRLGVELEKANIEAPVERGISILVHT